MAEDYPQDQLEFDEWFATDEACQAYLERLRWPEGFSARAVRRTKRREMDGDDRCACGVSIRFPPQQGQFFVNVHALNRSGGDGAGFDPQARRQQGRGGLAEEVRLAGRSSPSP